jgi:glutathione S-transferase
MPEHLRALELQLAASGGPWILGERFTLADVSWLVVFERLDEQDAIGTLLRVDRCPGVVAYWERLRARSSYAEAIVAHRHPSVERGRDRLRIAKAESPALRILLEGSDA